MPDIGISPIIVAQEEGYFTEQNLNLELILFKSAKDQDVASQIRQLNSAISDLLAVYFLNSNGLKVKAVSVIESCFLLFAVKNSRITGLEDLENVEMGLSFNTVIEYVVDTIISGKEVNVRKVSVPQILIRMKLLRIGQLPTAFLPDPWRRF
ncbi:hypothetical protein BBF96_06475 [Anoxybacter fermentans]|uniref:SsuA/THI5-like domain-containing protein n=1 Tax=Anoxybacter fermentans TaxID=1323375 RepID=A0A3S9SXS7_9FIRM|nr:ABC transporter substrate-binding protein [Anoxybacter fermentans]AZR73060.1 hypothetical protein BBF96_06475 [Anoxybacter fermentans]